MAVTTELFGGDRIGSMISGIPTEDVFIWTFWIPKEYLEKVTRALKPYEELTEASLIEPDEDEVPPTLLKNPGWSSSMEPLTLMYGTPTYGGTDPTSLMAPFFFLFLGMCFGDAGYGLLLSGVFGYFLVRHQLNPVLRKFFVMLYDRHAVFRRCRSRHGIMVRRQRYGVPVHEAACPAGWRDAVPRSDERPDDAAHYLARTGVRTGDLRPDHSLQEQLEERRLRWGTR